MPILFRDPAVAKKISDLMLNISGQLDESVAFVVENCAEEEAKTYAQIVGGIMGIVGLDLLNRIYKDFPQIKPTEYPL